MSRTPLFLILGGFLTFSTAELAAENWPGWRGPRGDGTSQETNLPTSWSANENIAWKVRVPYTGHASPVIWKNTIFLVGADQENAERKLLALDRRDGSTLWERTVLQAPLEHKHNLNSFASSTPATDGERVFVSFLDEESMFIAAYDFQGNLLWKVRPGVFSSVHGYCSSPVLYKNMVIINGDHDGKAYLVALDQKTGETIWKTPRENQRRSYCTPIIRTIEGRTQLLLSGSECVASYNPEDGSRYWILDGPTEQFVASLVFGHNLLYLTAGFPEKHVMAIDPTGTGNVTKTHVAWWHPRKEAAYVPSPILDGEYLYVISDSGIGYCYHALNGEMQWRERMGRRFSASLVSAEGKVFFLDDDGNTTVIQSGPKYQVLGTNKLDEHTYASPAISQGQIFIRGEQHLFCIGKRAEN